MLLYGTAHMQHNSHREKDRDAMNMIVQEHTQSVPRNTDKPPYTTHSKQPHGHRTYVQITTTFTRSRADRIKKEHRAKQLADENPLTK